jgi:hypothetical protein
MAEFRVMYSAIDYPHRAGAFVEFLPLKKAASAAFFVTAITYA